MQGTSSFVAVVCISLFHLPVTAAQEGSRRGRSVSGLPERPASSQPSTRPAVRRERQRVGPPQSTRLRLDVFTVTLSVEKGAEFSLDALPAAAIADPKELLAALGKLGEAAMPFRFDEQIDLAAETELTSGQRVPVVKNVTVARGGTVVPSITYEKVGCIIDLVGQWRDGVERQETASVKLRFTLADVARSPIELSEKVQLPVFVELSVERDLAVTSGRPILSAALSPQRSKEVKTVGYTACIVRLQLDRLDAAK